MAPSITYHKGLLNGPGQNNCFLNSAVQVLWHLDIFRRSFRELSGHACMADSCIFCALKDLFGQLQFSHERALPPDALRKALAQSFSDEHRFQLGFMDDAAECFENILLRIHFHIAHSEEEDMCNAKHCIPHQKFAMTLVEQSVCGVCHATSEPLPFTQMVHYVSASALISQANEVLGAAHPDLFGQLLKKAGGMGDIRDCPSSCGAKIQIRRTLINRPEIVSVGIVWDSDRPSLEHIVSLLDTLRTHLRLSDVFHGSFDGHPATNVYHQLVGVVTYYGKHYSTFFFHTKMRVWVYFDDAHVKEVGPLWENVVEKCRRGRYQPLLLLFATPNGTPIDSSSAPKSIKLVDKPSLNMRSGHDVVGKSPIQRGSMSPVDVLAMGGRRSLTPSPEKCLTNNEIHQRRAVTPNPEQNVNVKSILPNNDYQNLAHFQEVIFNRSVDVCEEQMSVHQQDALDKYKHPVRKDLVRRDSGNWSGDRNSASSSSSTSLENPYHYILGKMHMRNCNGVPRSPNKNGDMSSGSGNSSGGPADPGYDSFSISSTDSYPVHQNMKTNFQLAQIPEVLHSLSNTPYAEENARVADDCERLCAEVDLLLDRSERAEDLITALSLCNAAVNKARAAMNAPYSNPQTASFATMKHNACVLRARSLHRKLEEPFHNNLKYGEVRHSREGSNSSARGSGSHSRQNSKDKGNHSHSRQNSQELLNVNSSLNSIKTSSDANEKMSPTTNIEIYATLPKNKKGFLLRSSAKTKNFNFIEDEEYLMSERPSRGALSSRSKVTSKKEVEKRTRSEDRSSKNIKEIIPIGKDKEKKAKEQKKQSKQEEKQNKKQHKIRRKLLMGGLIRRKNRSMPDLREDEASGKVSPIKAPVKETSKDDSMVGSKTALHSNLNGYLSEGNLEYAGNPRLERSKLMRKSFHDSKIIPFNKVPPPPPLRTTSQLSKNDCAGDSKNGETVVYANHSSWLQTSTSLPYLPANLEEKPKSDAVTYSNGGFLLAQAAQNTVVTEALVHHDASFQSLPPPADQSDVHKMEDVHFQLPPYPSPVHSNAHSRQASEEFPPPPSALPNQDSDCNLISRLQEKCEKLSLNSEVEENKSTDGENWLRELQAKQANRRKVVDPQPVSDEKNYVKDLKCKFEQVGVDEVDFAASNHKVEEVHPAKPSNIKSPLCKSDSSFEGKRKSGKKKNVTFCEQVVLVATADEDESDGYIPNPILERVLRKLHKESNSDSREHAVHSVVPLKRTDSWRLSQSLAIEDGGKPNLEVMPKAANQSTALEECDEVDGFCPPPVSQVQNHPTPYIAPNTYSPNYMPASSLCPRSEYPENNLSNDHTTETEYCRTNHKVNNDGYHDVVSYSPVSSSSSPMQNGYYSVHASHPANSASNSPPYQPTSLQFYPPQNRQIPQIQLRENDSKMQMQTLLTRQNSNASHHNRQLPPQDPRRLPILQTNGSVAGPKMAENHKIPYVNHKPYPGRCSPSCAYGNESPRTTNGVHHPNVGIYHGYGEAPRAVPNQQTSNNSTNQPFNNNNMAYHQMMNQSSNKINPNVQYNNGLHIANGKYPHSNPNSHSSPLYALHQNGSTLSDNSPNQHVNSTCSDQYTNNYHHQRNNTNTHQPHYYPLNTSNTSACENGSQQFQHRNMAQNSSPYDQHCRNQTYNGSPYQHVPHGMPNGNANYQPASKFVGLQRENLAPAYQHPPQTNVNSPVYQRVPTPVQQSRQDQNLSSAQKYQPYQHPPMPKQIDNDRKIACSVPCNLCRKKQISPPSVYCTDCDFYISRFKQKT